MKFERKIFQVKSQNQKFVTIPSQAPFQAGDIVSIELVRTKEEQEAYNKKR